MSGMQPLIRLRLLASRLKQHELDTIIKSVIESYTADQILSFMFNHFVLKYQQTKEHDNDVSHMIQMISDILNAREKTIKSNNSNAISTKINIDSIPFDMIGECASFLHVSDYVSFSKCNRKTYIGCNSPATLQTFGLNSESIGCDLNRFPLLKNLALSNQAFKHYIELNPNLKTLDNLHSLTLYNDYKNAPTQAARDPTFDATLLSKGIHVGNIRDLTCFGIGVDLPTYLFNSKSFCDLLSSFNQVSALRLRRVFLTGDLDIESVSNILPKLRHLRISSSVNDAVLRLRNKLLVLYSKQLVGIGYDESKMDINVCCFSQLKAIWVRNPNADTLLKIIHNAPDLSHFACEIPMASHREFNKKKFNTIIHTLFDKCIDLETLRIIANDVQIQQIMKWMESALHDANNKITKRV
eukprot:1029311_1